MKLYKTVVDALSKLPIDLGQGSFKHTTKAKEIAFAAVPKDGSGKKALDVGCGDGYWSEKMIGLGYATTSVDEERTYPNVDSDHRYERMLPVDLNKALPYEDNSFDVVWCSEVIEHLTEYKLAIKEMKRVTKPGGVYIITTPNSFFWLHYLLLLFGLENKDWQNSGHVNFFHTRDIKTLFPGDRISGYFPYFVIKCEIRNFVSLLSPNFVIVGQK